MKLIQLGCKEFGKVFGFEAFKTLMCPKEVHPLIFAQMCTLYHQGKVQTQSVSHTSFNSLQSDSVSGSSVHVSTSQINSKFQKKTLVQVRKQSLSKYGFAAHTRLSAFQPIQ